MVHVCLKRQNISPKMLNLGTSNNVKTYQSQIRVTLQRQNILSPQVLNNEWLLYTR